MNFELYFKAGKAYECAACIGSIDNGNYVLYKEKEDGEWKPFQYCSSCITHLLQTGWSEYLKQLKEANCEAALRRLLIRDGPPINFRDSTIKCDNEKSEVFMFYFSEMEQPAKLDGSLTGEDRNKFLSDQLQIYSLDP
jgi:hypothetical protein